MFFLPYRWHKYWIFLSCGLKYSWTCPQNSRTAGKNSRTFQGESLRFAFSFKVFSRIPCIKTFQDLCESSQKKTNSCFQNSLPPAIIWIKTNLTARYSLSRQTKDHLPRLSGSSTSLTLTAQIPSWRHLKIKKCLSLVKSSHWTTRLTRWMSDQLVFMLYFWVTCFPRPPVSLWGLRSQVTILFSCRLKFDKIARGSNWPTELSSQSYFSFSAHPCGFYKHDLSTHGCPC